MANRLSENKDWKVLLVEAGGDPPMESEASKKILKNYLTLLHIIKFDKVYQKVITERKIIKMLARENYFLLIKIPICYCLVIFIGMCKKYNFILSLIILFNISSSF